MKCPNCGKRMQKEETQDEVEKYKCPACGHLLFCSKTEGSPNE